MPSARKRPTPLLFYGYPVELIADWCAVSRHTAYLYKIGARKPSRQALRLFVLNRDGRVLDDTWKGWAISIRQRCFGRRRSVGLGSGTRSVEGRRPVCLGSRPTGATDATARIGGPGACSGIPRHAKPLERPSLGLPDRKQVSCKRSTAKNDPERTSTGAS